MGWQTGLALFKLLDCANGGMVTVDVGSEMGLRSKMMAAVCIDKRESVGTGGCSFSSCPWIVIYCGNTLESRLFLRC